MVGLERNYQFSIAHHIFEDFYEWVDAIEVYFDGNNTPEDLKCTLVSYLLEGEVEIWWRQLRLNRLKEGKANISSWPKMKTLLFKYFMHIRCSIKYRSQAYSCSPNAHYHDTTTTTIKETGEAAGKVKQIEEATEHIMMLIVEENKNAKDIKKDEECSMNGNGCNEVQITKVAISDCPFSTLEVKQDSGIEVSQHTMDGIMKSTKCLIKFPFESANIKQVQSESDRYDLEGKEDMKIKAFGVAEEISAIKEETEGKHSLNSDDVEDEGQMEEAGNITLKVAYPKSECIPIEVYGSYKERMIKPQMMKSLPDKAFQDNEVMKGVVPHVSKELFGKEMQCNIRVSPTQLELIMRSTVATSILREEGTSSWTETFIRSYSLELVRERSTLLIGSEHVRTDVCVVKPIYRFVPASVDAYLTPFIKEYLNRFYVLVCALFVVDMPFVVAHNGSILAWKSYFGSDFTELVVALNGHGLSIITVVVGAMSMLSGSEDSTIYVWDFESRQCEKIVSGRSKFVTVPLCWGCYLFCFARAYIEDAIF